MRPSLAAIFTGWTQRRAANVGTLVLALANAVISYDALAAASRSAGLPWLLSWLFPLATDGIIAVATPAQLELRKRSASGWVRGQIGVLLWAAIVFSVVGNASRASQLWAGVSVHGLPLPTWSAVWLALPPLAYAGALHVLGLVHRYPAPDADEARLREELAETQSALEEARAEASSLARSIAEGRGERAAKVTPNNRPKGARKRAPRGSRADDMRALLAEPGALTLTGKELGARLGIDAGYARRLRSEVAPALDGASHRESA